MDESLACSAAWARRRDFFWRVLFWPLLMAAAMAAAVALGWELA